MNWWSRSATAGPACPWPRCRASSTSFYRAPGAPAGGTGLGLSIVKGFVEAQGGTVQATNRAGGGALFTITLPVGEPPAL